MFGRKLLSSTRKDHLWSEQQIPYTPLRLHRYPTNRLFFLLPVCCCKKQGTLYIQVLCARKTMVRFLRGMKGARKKRNKQKFPRLSRAFSIRGCVLVFPLRPSPPFDAVIHAQESPPHFLVGCSSPFMPSCDSPSTSRRFAFSARDVMPGQ